QPSASTRQRPPVMSHLKRCWTVSERTLIGVNFWLRNGRRPHATAAAWVGCSTVAIVSVGHTLKRPSVSSSGGETRPKRCARSGPSTVDSVDRPHNLRGLHFSQTQVLDRLLAQLVLLDLAGHGHRELAHHCNV